MWLHSSKRASFFSVKWRIADEMGRLLERHDLFSQPTVACERLLAQGAVGCNHRVDAHWAGLVRVAAASAPLSRLKAVIISSHCGRSAPRSLQNCCDLRRAKSASATPCCSTQLKY